MSKSLSNEDLMITPELGSRPCPKGDPDRTNRPLHELIAKLNGGATVLQQYLAEAAADVGGGDAGCTGGLCLVESGPDGEQRMRLVAISEAEGSKQNFNLSLGQCPCSLCLEQPGVMLLKEPQRHFEDFNPTTRPIAELLLVPFGTGTPEPGTLWLAAHGDHRFHQGHADALQLLAEQGTMVYQNVRERERMAARLERRSDQNNLLDRLPVGIAKLDQEYRYTYLNDRAIASLKTSQDHLLGRSVWEVYPEVAGTFVEDAYRSTMEQGVVSNLELYFTPVETWFDLEAHPAEGGGIVVFFFDAKQRKLSESDLVTALASEERNRRYYTTILNTTPDFAYIWGADYKFLYANKSLLDLYGLKEEEYVGRSFRDVGYPEWHARMHEHEIDEVVRTGKPLRGKIPFQSKGGGGTYDYIFMPVFGPDGEVEAIAGTTRDVTAQERSAEALKEADKRKDEFLAVLAHELRNPLAPLRTGVELLSQDPEIEVVRQAHDIMARQIEHMVHLVDDLMDLSRVNRGAIDLRKAPLQLRSVLETALQTVRPLIVERKHRLTVEFAPAPLNLIGDSTRLAQIFSNLLNNAAKYTEPGGDITLRVQHSQGEATITITDTGIGIDPGDQHKVFEMFAQVDRTSEKAKGGLGIGLNIVQRLVQMHGGTITLASVGRGKGSTFTVTLPLNEEKGPAPALPVQAVPKAPSLRILIVDDNVDAAFVLSMLLKRMDHEVHATHGGEDAIELMAGFKPDVVFLDIGMPGMDGYEVCRRMRVLLGAEHCFIVALTGWGQQEDKQRATDAGFDRHLVKPVDRETIMQLLVEFTDKN